METPSGNTFTHLRPQHIESDADDQLILRVPFTGSVKLRSLLLRAGPLSQTPTKIRLVRILRTTAFGWSSILPLY